MTHQIELVHFTGCPHAAQARENLRLALRTSGARDPWSEWDLAAPEAPERVRGYGSPTILVNGADVSGGGPEGGELSCRVSGAPSVEAILNALGGTTP